METPFPQALVDYEIRRAKDRHKPRPHRWPAYQPVTEEDRRNAKPPEFIAIDGEGITKNGRHIYTLLMASTGETVENWKQGLSTASVFEYLMRLKERHPDATFVMFSHGYDVNMWLQTLGLEAVRPLWENKRRMYTINHATYSVMYIPRKQVMVSRGEWHKKEGFVRDTTINVWDTWGFFQRSFVRTIQEWMPEINAAEIERMKKKRGQFRASQKESIKRYCLKECQYLVTVCDRLCAALQGADMRPQRWDGPGAIAATILRRHKISEHINAGLDELDAVKRAYFGGRTEIMALGMVGDLHTYDINSAYPYQISKLPSLLGAHWVEYEKCPSLDSIADKPAIVHCTWAPVHGGDCVIDWQHGFRIAPFPWRDDNARVYYFDAAKGWYWLSEVLAAIDTMHPHYHIKLGPAYVLEGVSKEPLFPWVNDLYRQRLEYKHAKDMRHIPIKLGLNSMYGKMAQSMGWQQRIPPYRSYVWAGMVTAGTRAQILRAMMLDPDAIRYVATDGIKSYRPLNLPLSEEMGDWEHGIEKNVLLLQSGFYVSGEEVGRSRGYGPKELGGEQLIEAWNKGRWFVNLDFTVNRFVGMGLALHAEEYDWCQWQDMKRHFQAWNPFSVVAKELDFMNPSKAYVPTSYGKRYLRANAKRGLTNYALVPTSNTGDESRPFRAKGHALDIDEEREYEKRVLAIEQPDSQDTLIGSMFGW